jgi:hypothetical protein
MAHHHNPGLATIFFKVSLHNIGIYVVANYDKILGAIFTLISILYISWKWWNEYKNKKKK